LYVGLTNDILRRFKEHTLRTIPEAFTARYTFDRLVYIEVLTSQAEAERRERQVKGWSRKKKLDLIERENPRWHDLSPRIRDLSFLK
jgi:putative endonuclease